MEIGNNGPKAKQMPDLQPAIHNGVYTQDLLSLPQEGISMILDLEIMERSQEIRRGNE